MRVGSVRLSTVSVTVLVVQLVIVSLIAAKYLYQCATCPRVWTRSAVYDPELFMRGRYLGLRLTVDGCAAAKTLGEHTLEQPNTFVTPVGVRSGQIAQFEAVLAVQDNKLIAHRAPERDFSSISDYVSWRAGALCDAMTLVQPVNFYIAEHAASPLPIQLALKHQDGAWQPLTYR